MVISRAKKIFHIVLFIVLFCIIYFIFGKILAYKYFYPVNGSSYNYARQFDGFYDIKKNTLDFVVLGASNSMPLSVNEIYKKYKFKGYNLSTSSQQYWHVIYLLEEIFKYQNPKLVVLDVAKIQGNGTKGPYNASICIHDNLRFGLAKIKLSFEIVKKFHENDNYISCFSLLYKYHSRWKIFKLSELKETSKHYYLHGPAMPNKVVKIPIDISKMNELDENYRIGRYLEKNIYSDKKKTESLKDYPPYSEEIGEKNINFLKEINKICKKNGAKLLLIKVPNLGYPQDRMTRWTKYRRKQVKRIFDKIGIEYVDFMYDLPVDIDLDRDSYDGGSHLNFVGGAKIGIKLGEYINSLNLFKNKSDNIWDKDIQIYESVKKVANLQTENKFINYIHLLEENYKDKLILINSVGDFQKGLSVNEKNELKKIGNGIDFINNSTMSAYIKIIDDGEIKYEVLSNMKKIYKNKSGKYKYEVCSCSFTDKREAYIKIDGRKIVKNKDGINILVFDKESGIVIDDVNFNTTLTENDRSVERNNSYYDYEYFLIEGEKAIK